MPLLTTRVHIRQSPPKPVCRPLATERLIGALQCFQSLLVQALLTTWECQVTVITGHLLCMLDEPCLVQF